MQIRSVILAMGLILLSGFSGRASEPYFWTFGNRTLYYERYKAGSEKLIQTTTLDIGAAVKAVIQNVLPRAHITYSGGVALMPMIMEVGDVLPECHCEVKVSGFLTYHIDVTERVVLRKEILTTPAGTYDCVVVREHKVEEGPMHHWDFWSDTWYAPGIGYVRHDNFDKRMRLESIEILVEDRRYPTQ